MNAISKYPLLILLLVVQTGFSQVAFVDKQRAQAFKNASQTIVVLAAEDAKTSKKLAKKKGADYVAVYKGMVDTYNARLKGAFEADWRFNTVRYMNRSELAGLKSGASSDENTYFIACVGADEMLAEAALATAKSKKNSFDFDDFLIRHDEASSLDILHLNQLDDYFLSKADWDLRQEKKMTADKRLGKSPQLGDYLRHRMLPFVGFYLSQHALPTASDLHFGLHYLQEDLDKAATGGKKVEINKMPPLAKGNLLAQKTLLIGRDLTNFPNGKTNLTEADIKKTYPHPFKIVGQAEIEKAFAERNGAYCAILPAVRWSPTGYPELLMFYVVDAADALTIISFADTGSGSNPMTANQFELSQEMKAKHFQEINSKVEE